MVALQMAVSLMVEALTVRLGMLMTAPETVTAALRAGLVMALKIARTKRMDVTLHAIIVMVVTALGLEIQVGLMVELLMVEALTAILDI